ncbi:threonine synthase [Spirosomataceae bacterium TFI 002]|nr:threonine synthase [Spirosomataceae bacterium TFI 002]
MKLYSTNHKAAEVTGKEAIFEGLPSDNGLFMPTNIPNLGKSFWDNIHELSLQEIAFEVSNAFLSDEINTTDLKAIIDRAIDFDAPLKPLEGDLYCLELFHGPSMAFKDFGARFMAGVMSHFLKKESKNVHILVATSGDTGGAVAQGFYKYPNIFVHILYPTGKVSDIQEKQLTTLGENVSALEINGTFDDCQALVKQAFLDTELRSRLNLASANSINIARLIPQAFYYAYSYAQLKQKGKPVVFSIPSGNFGNLCAAVIAYKMGMPVHQFLAATNANKVVPTYLSTGEYTAIKPSISTISNAMDVGNPSNFPRLVALFDNDIEKLRSMVKGFWYNDDQTRTAMKEVNSKYQYVVCPHTAIAYQALEDFKKDDKTDFIGVFAATAHYAKFLGDVEPTLNEKLAIPTRLSELLEKEKNALPMEVDYDSFKSYLNKQVH